MESMTVEPPKRRGRKRKIVEVNDMTVDSDGKKKVVETRSLKLLGRYVRKEFQGSGLYLGKITSYDSGLYRVKYEDGDFEDLDSGEAKAILIEDGVIVGEWSERKEKLDEILISKDVNVSVSKVGNIMEQVNINQVDMPLLSEPSNSDAGVCDAGNNDVDADSSNDSSEETQERDTSLLVEVPALPPPELPPSSGHISVPEEYVSHLLSVHNFLRSFSVPLFLYPFSLDDFVGALNCTVANTLLDSVHVALMRVLKGHIEKLSADGSELALKCLRLLDWSLLDTLTWPVYLVHYLTVMSHRNGPDWNAFYTHSLEQDYYTLSAGKKLIILQILCDDVLDSEEIKAEMDMREASEVGIDMETSNVVAPIAAPRRVHPRNSKTSACKAKEALHNVAEFCDVKLSHGSHFVGSRAGRPIESPIDEDGNGDECRLCGMDGFLLCCDGCPSSYHVRCLGLNKMYMPEGSWYCPECKINATEPKILQGTDLRGGHNFGVDPYEQVFVATCDLLLILKASVNSEICLRYYKKHDIPKVLSALYSKSDHVVMYSEICSGIVQYWELTKLILPCNEMSKASLQLADQNTSGESTLLLVTSLDESSLEKSKTDNTGGCGTGTSVPEMAVSSHMDCTQELVTGGNSLDTLTKSDQLSNVDSTGQQSSYSMNNISEPAFVRVLTGQPGYVFEPSQQRTSSATDTVSYITRNSNIKYVSPVNGTSLEAKVPLPSVELNIRGEGKPDERLYDGCLYMGSSFKINIYVNHYLHGDFAASAAANLAILSSEENPGPDPRSSDNRRKVMSQSVSLQMKALSSAAQRFFWPITEKKLGEVPRERCSWCFSCKAPVVSKRGCLLNAAASNAIRGATKLLAGVRPVKNGDGRLLGISTYIMFMEESLSGLLIGPFLNETFRKRWLRQVEQAATCNSIKILLLELEENIRTIALSGDWMKLGDGCSTQSSASQIAANAAGSIQKRRPGRRGRKPAAVVEVAVEDSQDMSKDFTFWRGGTLSKLMFHRAALPCQMIRKAACQGGSKKIPGILYAEGSETPKTSRQLIWRSAVEMSRNVAQLALQVRYLDLSVRWSDLFRPEQTPSDGKGQETEASAFRNAFVCDKKILGHEIRYCVAFSSQKHLPSRVMKCIAEVEQTQNGQEKFWFSEAKIPLYLIKDYEEKVEKTKTGAVLSRLQKKQKRRQLKASRKNIFLYLMRKQDNTAKTYCSLCHQEVSYGDAVKCSACQGFCHYQCTTSSTDHINEEVEFLITCKRCFEARAATRVQSSNGSPTSPLLLKGQDLSNTGAAYKHGKSVGRKGSSASGLTREHPSGVKSINCSSSSIKSINKNWGLILRRNTSEDTGIDFRLKNIFHKGNQDMNFTRPSCRLCNQPYNADHMYIRCETCQCWFHADALELDESKFLQLIGFKCCKCRRIKSPVCPYLDPEKKRMLEDKIKRSKRTAKMKVLEMDSDSGAISGRKEEASAYVFSQNADTIHVAPDPFLVSLSELDQGAEDVSAVYHGWSKSTVSGPGPRKLPVRRQIKQEKDPHCVYPADPILLDNSAPFEANVLNSAGKLPVRRSIKKENNNLDFYSTTSSFEAEVPNPSEANAASSVHGPLSPQVQWDVAKENFDDGITLDYESLGYDDMEFEPQTYFSFNELLAADDGSRVAGNDYSLGNVVENWENSYVLPENGSLDISYDQEEPAIFVETLIEKVACKICSHSEPCPDLSCQACGMWIHSHCSPWVESSSWEDGWRCGNCREWR